MLAVSEAQLTHTPKQVSPSNEGHDNNNNSDDDDDNVTDADAPTVLYLKRQRSAKRSRVAVTRIRLVVMAGTRQHVQHLHEIATNDSRPALQKTVLPLRQEQQHYRER